MEGEDENEDEEVLILQVEDDRNEENESYVFVDDDDILTAVFDIFKEKFKDEFDFADSRKLRLHEVIPTETRLTITNRQSLQDVKILHLNIYHLKPVTHIQRMQDTREIPMRNPARRMLTR